MMPEAVLKGRRMNFVICVLTCLAVIMCLLHMKGIKTIESVPIKCTYVSPVPMRQSRCSYVGFEIPKTGNRLGNHLFYYSAVMYVARLTGRTPCIWTSLTNTLLDGVFDLDIAHVDITWFGCPLYRFTQRGVGVYDARVEALLNVSDSESLVLKGPFGSWKYAEPIAGQLRQQLRFRPELAEFVADFLVTSVPEGWTSLKFVRVGVHVRRGDFLSPWALSRGFTTADEWYLRRAMSYFVERFPRVQFIVASNDIGWCRKHVRWSAFNETRVNITFSVGHNAGQDLALLASCDHTVMTTGTYSWWAAWLANGTTVYYANFPKRGSWLSTQMRDSEYYHPDWIGIDDLTAGAERRQEAGSSRNLSFSENLHRNVEKQ